jgi:hypothetical protein
MTTDRSRPFCREEDDARREEQRRWLRTVDSGVVERAIVGYFRGLPEIPDHVDRLLVEDALRQFANKQRKEHKKAWRDRYTFGERAGAMQAALTLLKENWDPSTGTTFQLGNLQQEADDTMNEFYGLADPPDEEFFALVRTVSAVVLADELAEDGYRDPRVVSRWGPRQL